jgi:hypothetical protein
MYSTRGHQATLAYLAGFFDGEGCVYIIRHRRKKPPLTSFSMEISFTCFDKALWP